MAMLIVEDVMLLLLDDLGGRESAAIDVDVLLGGAVLVELALARVVWAEPKRGLFDAQKVFPVPGVHVADPLLQAALATVGAKPRTANRLVVKLGEGLREAVIARLYERGLVRPQRRGIGGAFGFATWPAQDSRHELELRTHLDHVLTERVPLDLRSAAIISILSASGYVNLVLGSLTLAPNDVVRRAEDVLHSDWAPGEVRDAVNAASAAVLAMVASTTDFPS